MEKKQKQPVVVLGLRKQALPIVRSLAEISSYDVFLFIDARTLKEEAEHTRYGHKIRFMSVQDIQDKLEEIQKKYASQLYVYVIAAYLLTELRENFRSLYNQYHVLSSPLTWIDLFTNKAKMYSFVGNYGVKTAPAVLLSQYVPGCLNFPLVLKRNVEYFLSFKTKLVNTEKELSSFVDTMPDDKKHVLVQELVCASQELDLSYQAYVHKGNIKGRLVLEEVRHYPEGISCFLREIDGELKDKVINNSESFLKDTDYSGFIQIDYKYLVQENLLVIMDINTRTPASHSAFSHKFSNYSQLFACIDTPPVLLPKQGILKWVNVSSDLKWHIRRHDYKGIFGIFFATWDIWSWKDPLPFCMSMLQPLINRFKKHSSNE